MKAKKRNRLIVEFMGLKPHHRNKGNEDDSWWDYKDEALYYLSDLPYSTSWDWLMPVVAEILAKEPLFREDYYLDEMQQNLTDVLTEYPTDIKEYWKACARFIKWYNKGVRKNVEKL